MHEPKPAMGKNDLAKIQYVFDDEIFAVHVLSDIFVILLNGKVFKHTRKNSEKNYNEIFDLKETVKHTGVLNGLLYAVTPTCIYRIEDREGKRVNSTEEPTAERSSKENSASVVHKDDFSKICALDISHNEEIIAWGDYEGRICVKTAENSYDYTEHEDAIIDIVVIKSTIFSACEDGMLLKTRINKTEPTDAYEIGKPIRYFGWLEEKLVILDGYGMSYTLSRKANDLKKGIRLTRKITDVIKTSKGLYISHNNEYYKVTGRRNISKINVPPMGVDGVFEYRNKIYCYKGQEIRGWKEKKATELDEFFEDL